MRDQVSSLIFFRQAQQKQTMPVCQARHIDLCITCHEPVSERQSSRCARPDKPLYHQYNAANMSCAKPGGAHLHRTGLHLARTRGERKCFISGGGAGTFLTLSKILITIYTIFV